MTTRVMFMLAIMLIIGRAQATSPQEEDLIPGDYWASRDRTEVILAFPTKEQVWYFNNNSDRLCYTFTVSGNWKPGGKPGLLVSEERRAIVSVLLISEKELKHIKGNDILTRAVNFMAMIYEKAHGRPPDSSKVAPFESSRAGSIKWSAYWITERAGKPVRAEANKVFVEIAPGWIAQITASYTADGDEMTRDIIETLGSKTDPECYWPLIHKFVPSLDKK